LVDDLTQQLQAEVTREAQACKQPGCALEQAKAYLRAVAQMGTLPPCKQYAKALTAICTTDPDLVQRVQERMNVCRRDSATRQPNLGDEELEALHLRLVADGLWMADLFGSYPIDAQQRERLLQKLGV